MLRHTLENLEARTLLSSYFINTNSDDAGDASGTPDGFVSLREAIVAASTNAAFGDAEAGDANGDEIRFAASVAGSTITLGNGEFEITDDLSIRGENRRITIDARDASRVFDVETDEDVAIFNLTLTNGRSPTEGGAVNLEGGGRVLLSGMLITGSSAGGDGGGAVYNGGSDLTIRNSVLSDNDADGASGSGGALLTGDSGTARVVASRLTGNTANRAGGAIEIVDGTLDLDSTGLVGNSTGASPGNGGGIHVTGAARVTVFNSLVSDNDASLEGGGLWNSATGEMIVRKSRIDLNTASGDAADDGGGGIFNNGGDLLVANSQVNDNDADGTAGSGGGIFSVGGDVAINLSTLSRNIAHRAGGGVEVIAGEVAINLSVLSDNVTDGPPGNGGALHVTADADVTVDRSRVTGNTAALEGGGLWNSATGTMRVISSDVRGNTASGDAADDGGGGIFNNGGTLSVVNSLVRDNVADGTAGSGGGIFSVDGDVDVSNTRITGNVANRAGGGIEIVAGDLDIATSGLVDNTAGPDGSASPGNGGALHVTADADVTVFNTLVQFNDAALEGGGLWNSASGAMVVSRSKVDGNVASGAVADDGGGGIFNNGGTLDVVNTLIDDNRADGAAGSGGGILSIDGDVDVLDSTLSDNTARRAGGGVEIVAGSIDLTRTTLDGNSTGASPGNGGALHVTADAAVGLYDSDVRRNRAALEGGGLWNSATGTMVVRDSFIEDNAAQGDAADDGGGGIFNNGGTLYVTESTVRRNDADANGGGIFNDGTLIAARSRVVDNDADGTGGGIFTDAGATTTVIGTAVDDNDPNNFAGSGTVNA